jgi:hypothetical protein
MLRLHHVDLPVAVHKSHIHSWKYSALPRLKAVAEGRPKPGTHLDDLALAREQCTTPNLHPLRERMVRR